MKDQTIIESPDLQNALAQAVESTPHDRLFLLADSNVEQCVFPLITDFLDRFNPIRIILPPGEEYKNLSSLSDVWEALADGGASRKSLLINLGGGVITDLGGFAAACFKRGISFINAPTTLLAAVDAAVGGKTGVDLNGLKNEIGAFAPAKTVILSTQPFSTLPDNQMTSGFAEIVKMAMIASPKVFSSLLVAADHGRIDLRSKDFPLSDLLSFAVNEKARIVKMDPHEDGLRKILNFGHTCGHAFETLLLRRQKPVTHGEAVAHGILVALILSNLRLKADSMVIYQYHRLILRPLFSRLPLNCDDIDEIVDLMRHDKKNTDGKISFILLNGIGHPVVSSDTPEADIHAALDIYFDMVNS